MPSLKGLSLGLAAVIIVGFIAMRTKAGEGLSSLASGITRTISAPLVGVGGGLKILGEGVSAFLSPTIAPTIAPKFDWSGWAPFGPKQGTTVNGNGNGNGKLSRIEDRTPQLPGYTPAPDEFPSDPSVQYLIRKRTEDRNVQYY